MLNEDHTLNESNGITPTARWEC